MAFPRKTTEDIDVNLTPLIDVVFLLLIFFMVSTTFTKETRLGLELPKADGAVAAVMTDAIEVTVNQEGVYTVNGQAVRGDAKAGLLEAIGKVSGGDHALPFVIVADANASHQSVVTVMEVAGQLGFSNLSISTQQVGD